MEGSTRIRGSARLALALVLAPLVSLAACGGASSPPIQVSAGPRATNPATGLWYVPEAHRGGEAPSMKLVGVFWGRLVDVRDVGGALLHRDFVIGPDIASDAVDFELERNPVTGGETLTILHEVASPEFEAAFARLEANLVQLLDKGLAANELPPFTMVARNAALSVRFDDLLADGGDPGDPGYPGRVHAGTVGLELGYPPKNVFDARVFPDPNHGDLVGGQFHSTRVILDLSISQLDAGAAGVPVNVLGLSEAALTTAPNLALRIPTLPSPGQQQVLENLSGGRLAFHGNGPNDPTSPTLDVVRAARSGGAAVGDPHNGFLPDQIAPRVLGAQAVSADLSPDPSGVGYRADLAFGTPLCAAAAREGDVLELPSHLLLVTRASKPPLGGVTRNVELELLSGDAAGLSSPVAAVGRLRSAYEPGGSAPPECYLRFSPVASQPPGAGVAVDADVIVSFSEPIDPASVLPSSSFVLEYGSSPAPPSALYRRVVGSADPSGDLSEYAFRPAHPLRHHGDATQPAERYLVSVLGQSTPGGGVRDLAGNPIEDELAGLVFTLDPAQPRVDSGGILLDFGATDEDGDGSPELRGQFFADTARGVVSPRAVERFSVGVNETQPMQQTSTLAGLPVLTPLSNLGSKLQTVWRYHDMNFSLLDESKHNLDLEGLWWEPFDGVPKLDFFPEFEMRVAHAAFLPDEGLTPLLLPSFPDSGLSNVFDQNYADQPLVVHPRAAGYQIFPQVVLSEEGRSVAAWPYNQGLPQSQFVYWTWRDTAQLVVGGPNGVGADTLAGTQKLGAAASLQGFFPAGQVPTIGLPLLMEFRTYRNDVSSAQNGFKLAYSIASSANPFFRTFSTGGILNSGTVIAVDPETEVAGSGGVNPTTGGGTPSQDLNVYFGQADFVVRVSRVHTAWLDALAGGASFAAAVEPRTQPDGTQLVLAYRGASALTSTGTASEPWRGAQNLSPYGDAYTSGQWSRLGLPDASFSVAHWPDPADAGWSASPSAVDGARYVQVRVSLLSNPESGVRPELSALGLGFRR